MNTLETEPIPSTGMTAYAEYLQGEWELYRAHPERFQAVLETVNGRTVQDVLDVGCGAGQELLPFVQIPGARSIGVDISPEAVEFARRRFDGLGGASSVEFRCASAERLPFEDDCFDVVICRVALPYTHNATALAEMARVLHPGGLLLLKIHHARYYLRRLRLALARGRLRDALGPGRVLLAGAFHHLTGWQPVWRLRPEEVFQTRWMLRRMFSALGLVMTGQLHTSDSNARAPLFLIEKTKP